MTHGISTMQLPVITVSRMRHILLAIAGGNTSSSGRCNRMIRSCRCAGVIAAMAASDNAWSACSVTPFIVLLRGLGQSSENGGGLSRHACQHLSCSRIVMDHADTFADMNLSGVEV